ncbi:MAG: NAD(P)/FAD-dependent oxidoreductase [Candidatus Marinimicrobia bacterium]|nr:NAD(P)/FAD-dependent oxidoreductase [Candidatus Neomarinimicrobiota bacterium]
MFCFRYIYSRKKAKEGLLHKVYDVIICGAGPAGSIAATGLRLKGLSVLLLDEKEFPRDKVCGDQITPLGIDLLKEFGMVDNGLLKYTQKIDKMLIQGPDKAVARLQFDLKENQSEIYIIPRRALDHHLVRGAENLGTERFTGHLFEICTHTDGISVKCRTGGVVHQFQGKVLIGADGSSSTVSRLAGLHPVKRRGIAIRAYLHGIHLQADRLEGYFDRKWLPGYAWLFPTSQNSANIGLGMNVDHFKKTKPNLKDLLSVFVDQPYIKSRLSEDFSIENIGTWPLNIGPPKWNQLYKDRLILIGDAASLINPFTGGGIETGIISGLLAAEVIAEHLADDDFSKKIMKTYAKRLKKKLNLEQTLFLIATKIVGASPWIVEFLIKLVEISDLPFIFMKYMYKGNRVKRVDRTK